MKKRALISVFKKDGVLELARFLQNENWEILSTGGTAKHLTQNGIAVTDVSSVTGFPECLDGRVKTLHPAVHAGILAIRSDSSHMETLRTLNIAPIDLVCVNLYPFFEKVQANLTFEETVEFIDIGGPTMLRAAAKNYQDVLVLTDPADYSAVMREIESGGKNIPLRRKLAGKVFNLMSAYDAAVSRFMLAETDAADASASSANCDEQKDAAFDSCFPEWHAAPLMKAQNLRYGENAHQRAALYLAADHAGAFGGMKQLQGKELSYNNIRDLDVAWKAVCAFNAFVKNTDSVSGTDAEGNAVQASFTAASQSVFTIALKHNTPCGAALGTTALDSYKKTYSCDPVSIFGGIIGCSAVIDKEAAEEMKKCFLEVIVAPGFTDEALAVFAAKKNLRLVTASVEAAETQDCLAVDGGLLVQTRDSRLFEKWDIVTKAHPTPAQTEEMAFGMTVAMFAKSNAIVVVKDKTALGIGCGQTNRIWAAQQALERAQAAADAAGMSRAEVLVSDAFFPFADCVEEAAKYGIKAIVQPGGSIRDQESIDACNKLGIAMVFTGTRHFKH
ncbi:MAG: bifunctional phosphoribosylaminoimidazolecarboxamide formyltransferase/IMP cyclohydrolase [Bacteroides sp.]|nr:bifunctional phosphoribosylaminoimidazolecarboxamide formyltransferase/IMP cyclohydrolase [Prevotella sp.]MCM1406936.1 bifunctional phosphoribosylaminoimidazolecarboxamide formyltransferase/IMP cyclohydrolase [Treponema brennaborense]MCM1470087.1 bifunctional phosphoribosylaminoimidazolecarboxamide formyltransferase/IMP cyclohydrolase [Bacteroides sp.]